MATEFFPAYKRQPVAPPDTAGIPGLALNVQIPNEVLALLTAQHDQIRELTQAVATLTMEHQAAMKLLVKIAQQQQRPRRMKRVPHHDENGRIEYVIDEEM